MDSERKDFDIVVIGAGAAGIIAAWRAATFGAKVVILEKTPRVGTKILISGGGKCNITHAGAIEDVLRGFRPNEARFIRPACYRFRNDQIVEMLVDRGLHVYTRPDGRVFPVDRTAKDVVEILKSYLSDAGVEVRFEHVVTGIDASDGKVCGVRFASKSGVESIIRANSAIVSVGGSSYPNSGTTGDGWVWAKALGHSVIKPTAALAPIYLNFCSGISAELSGVALRDCMLKARQAGKEIVRWQGDLLFTHLGVSGPTALGISREVVERLRQGTVDLEVDLAPDAAFESLASNMLSFARSHPKRLVSSFIDGFAPTRIVDLVLDTASLARDLPCSRLEKKGRNRLVEVLKGWGIGSVRAVPIEKGEVVAGGVSLDEVDPQTMRSSLVEGLFFCGEVLDVAGAVGGYNLQAAFATGFVAGESASRSTFRKG